MKYNPEIHNRRTIRLKNYDYTQNGAYFITLCVQNREYYFEQFKVLKNIVNEQWNKLTERFENVIIDEFVIMPDHVHGLFFIDNSMIIGQPQGLIGQPQGLPERVRVGDIVGAFKSICVVEWLKYIKVNNINVMGKFWQRNYYESIIRNESHLENVRRYIKNNPVKWEENIF